MRRSSPSRHLIKIYQDDIPGVVNFPLNIRLATDPNQLYSKNDPIAWKTKH